MKIGVAGLILELKNKYPYLEELAADFIAEGTPDIIVSASYDEISHEHSKYKSARSPGFAESLLLYSKIADELPCYDAFLIHGTAIATRGKAYLISAPSGVGKTTHARLWLDAFGDSVHIMSGDKPIIRYINGIAYLCGTPWRGKEHIGKSEMLPLGGIAYIERSAVNTARILPRGATANELGRAIYIPRKAENVARLLSLLDKVASEIPAVSVSCNMEKEAAYVSYNALVLGKCE